jgi:ribosomal protein S26
MIPKYTEEPERKPKNGWYCENCGRKLPKDGSVWTWRFQKYLNRTYRRPDNSGYYCDPCADAREQGAYF